MTALAANDHVRQYKTPVDQMDVTSFPVKASTHGYKNGIVGASSGYAVPATDTANMPILGVALEEFDNSAGSNGDIEVRVATRGLFRFAKTGTIVQGDIGKRMFVADDNTVALEADTTNIRDLGKLVALDGSFVWVELDLQPV